MTSSLYNLQWCLIQWKITCKVSYNHRYVWHTYCMDPIYQGWLRILTVVKLILSCCNIGCNVVWNIVRLRALMNDTTYPYMLHCFTIHQYITCTCAITCIGSVLAIRVEVCLVFITWVVVWSVFEACVMLSDANTIPVWSQWTHVTLHKIPEGIMFLSFTHTAFHIEQLLKLVITIGANNIACNYESYRALLNQKVS